MCLLSRYVCRWPHDSVRSVSKSLNNLALLMMDKAQYHSSEELYRRAVTIVSDLLGPDHVEVATSLNGLAVVLKKQGKLHDAETLYRGALDIQQKSLPENHPDLAVSYNNLATLYQSQGHFDDSEKNYRHALDIRMAYYGEAHSTVATSLSNLASLMNDMGECAVLTLCVAFGPSIVHASLWGANGRSRFCPSVQGGMTRQRSYTPGLCASGRRCLGRIIRLAS